MTGWLRTDVQFNLPQGVLTLHARSRQGQEFHAAYSSLSEAYKADGQELPPTVLASLVESFLKQCRPDLAEGLIVVGMSCSLMRNLWEFFVISQGLPLAEYGSEGVIQSVETCPICERPLRVGDGHHKLYLRQFPDEVSGSVVGEVCSKECVEANLPASTSLTMQQVADAPEGTILETGINWWSHSVVDIPEFRAADPKKDQAN